MKNIIDKFESNGEPIITPPKDKGEDDVIWNRFITNNVFTGFSIEGDFKTKPILDMAILDKFQNYLDSLNNTK